MAADDRQRAPLARALDRHHRRPGRRRGADRPRCAPRTTSSASPTCGRTGSSATTSAVYREVDGDPVHDFSGVDRVYDHIRSLGLYPVVEVSFMPHDLASDPTKTVFDYDAIISPPKDWERWHDLVRDLTAHLVERYGDEVRRALVLRGLERGQPRGLLVRARPRSTSGCTTSPSAAVRSVDSAARRRRPVVGRGRLGRGAARPRRGVRGAGRLRLDPHLRLPAAGLPADARALRPRGHADLVDRVGRHADPLQRGQRRGLRRAPSCCAGWPRRWAGSRRCPTGSSPTTSRSSAGRRPCCTAASGCGPSASCASRAGGRWRCWSGSARAARGVADR